MPDTLTVNLGSRSYPIIFGAELAASVHAQVTALTSGGRRVAVITDAKLVSGISFAMIDSADILPSRVGATRFTSLP